MPRDMPPSEEMFGETSLGPDRPEDEQVTVWSPDKEGKQLVWFENEDGECTMEFNPDERRWLIARLQEGLD